MSEEKKVRKEPMPASTVILVREHKGELQVYLLKRSVRSGFFPGNYVFPGGIVDPEDRDVAFWKTRVDLGREEIVERFGGGLEGDEALAYGVAAIRETFEEAGVLFAFERGSDPAGLERACDRRLKGGLPKGWMREWFNTEPWDLAFSRLGRWSHWITPKLMKRRFDTRFFIALMPPEQTCMPDNEEMTEGLWISPEKGLAGNLSGTVPLSPPTVVTLHELLQLSGVQDLERELGTRPWGEERRPRLIPSKHTPMILQPWDPLCFQDIDPDTRGLESSVLPPGEPFSRLWYHEGLWKPVRCPESH